jgi:DNA invertase Pin-like site-specific DNA recombinase
MKITGYIRVSTDKQTNDHWKMMLADYAQSTGLDNPVWIEETVTGKRSWKERKLKTIIDNAEAGDVLIVGEASRIGRDAADAMDFVKVARQKGMVIHIIQAGLVIEGDGADAATIVLPVLFGMAEYERKLLSYRTKLGLERARAEGKQLGGYRKKGEKVGGRVAHPQKANILKAVNAGGTIAGTARAYGVSTMTIYRWIKSA